MTHSGRVAKNTFILTALKLLLPASSMAMVLVVARYLGTDGLGRYSLVFSLLNVLSTVAFLGINAVISRDAAAMPEKLPVLLGNAMTLGTVASVLLIGLVAMFQSWLGYDQMTQTALLIVSLSIVPSTLLGYFEATFVALERMEFIALFSLSENVLKVTLSVVSLVLGYGLIAIMVIAVVTRILACVGSMLFIGKLGFSLRWSLDRPVLRQLVGAAPTFTLIAVFAMLISKIDIFILSKLGGMDDVGLYGAAGRILDIAAVLPASLCLSIYPGLARAASNDPASLPRLGAGTFRYLLMIILPLAVGATLLADPIMRFLYGEKFHSSAATLTVLVWMVFPYAWVRYYAYVLVAANRQRIDLILNVILLGMTTAANLLLIPHYGALGAALAMMSSMCLYALGQYLYLRRHLPGHLAHPPGVVKPIFATVVMALCVWFLRDLPVLLSVALGALVYFMTLWGSGFFTAAERQIIFAKLSLAQIGLRSKV